MHKLGVFLGLALGVALVAPAQAQDEIGGEPPMSGEPAMAPPSADSQMGTMMAGYPMEEVSRPLTLQAGMIEAGGDIGIFKAPDLGDAIGLVLRADYGLSDQLQVGVRLPLAVSTPDGAESFAGVWLNGLYAFHQNVAARLDVGYVHLGGVAGLLNFAPPLYLDADGMKLAFRLGATYKQAFSDQLALVVDPGLFFQLDGAFSDEGEAEMFQQLHLPVSLWYQLSSELAAALNTGIFSAHEFKFGADDGAWVPLYLTGQYTMVDGHLDLGANLGFGNVIPPEGGSVSDSLFLGLFANYRP